VKVFLLETQCNTSTQYVDVTHERGTLATTETARCVDCRQKLFILNNLEQA